MANGVTLGNGYLDQHPCISIVVHCPSCGGQLYYVDRQGAFFTGMCTRAEADCEFAGYTFVVNMSSGRLARYQGGVKF